VDVLGIDIGGSGIKAAPVDVTTGDLTADRVKVPTPRPALPEEVAQFDDEMLGRLRMRPGVTGLWQVEARHNPSYFAYRHLDLFYVENWTLTGDLTILLKTVRAVLKSEGVKFLEEIHPWGNSRAAMIEGPDRIAIEIVEIK